MKFKADLKLALLALTALALGACSTVPQENCTARLVGVPKAEDGTKLMNRDDERVLGFYTCRAAQGDKQAQLWLAEQYEQGSALVEADQEKAFKLYMQAATDDPTRTSIYVAGIKGNPGTVMSFANPGAKPGLPEAKYRVGLMYFEGRGVTGSTRRATRWMKQAAKRGHEGARNWLEAHGQRNRRLGNENKALELRAISDSLIAPKHWVAERQRRAEYRKENGRPAVEVPNKRPDVPDRIYLETRADYRKEGLLLAQEFAYFADQFDEGRYVKKWNSEIRIGLPSVDKRAANEIRALVSKEIKKLNQILPIRLDDKDPNVRLHIFGGKNEYSEPLYCVGSSRCKLMTSDHIWNRYRRGFPKAIYVSRQDPRFSRRTNSPYEGEFAFYRDVTLLMEEHDENVEGYIASNSSGEIFQAECYIFGNASIEEVRQHTLECLVRILGFPNFAEQLDGTLLAKYTNFRGTANIDSIKDFELSMVRALYRADISSGPD